MKKAHSSQETLQLLDENEQEVIDITATLLEKINTLSIKSKAYLAKGITLQCESLDK